MYKMTEKLQVALSVFVLMQLINYGFSMSCLKEHPQTSICRASFVIKARILNTDWTGEARIESVHKYPSPRILQVEIQNVFKGKKIIDSAKQPLLKIMYASTTGIDLKVGQSYVLTGWNSGKTLMMNQCNWHSLWSNLSRTQRFIATYSYKKMFCLCQIRACAEGNCKKDTKSCELDPKKIDCRSKSQLCMAWKGCKWMNPVQADTC